MTAKNYKLHILYTLRFIKKKHNESFILHSLFILLILNPTVPRLLITFIFKKGKLFEYFASITRNITVII